MRKVIVVILFIFFGLVIFHGLSQGMGKVHANKMLYFHVPYHEGADLDIEVNFKITRKEYSFDKRASLDGGNLSLFLEPNQLVYEMRKLKS